MVVLLANLFHTNGPISFSPAERPPPAGGYFPFARPAKVHWPGLGWSRCSKSAPNGETRLTFPFAPASTLSSRPITRPLLLSMINLAVRPRAQGAHARLRRRQIVAEKSTAEQVPAQSGHCPLSNLAIVEWLRPCATAPAQGTAPIRRQHVIPNRGRKGSGVYIIAPTVATPQQNGRRGWKGKEQKEVSSLPFLFHLCRPPDLLLSGLSLWGGLGAVGRPEPLLVNANARDCAFSCPKLS